MSDFTYFVLPLILGFCIGYSLANKDKPTENTNTPLYCISNKIYEKYEDKFYRPHYNAKTGLAEMCVEINSK